MWLLVSLRNPDERYELLTGKEYSIGRKECDVLLENDMSISRRHAVLQVIHPETNVSHLQKQPLLVVHDLSKLGTQIKDKRIKNAQHEAKNGDMVMFGTAGISKFKVVYEPFCATTSCLDGLHKKNTRELVVRLGGHVISEWRKSCDLLVMSSLSITIKAICAMIQQKPIVTSQYLESLIEAIDTREPRPSPEDFLPPLAESHINPNQVSFKPRPERQVLLQGKIFVFLSTKQFKKLSVAVELAGGTPILMEEGSDDNEDDILVQPETCVMSCDPMDQSQCLTQNAMDWIIHVMETLDKHKRRPILECEIGYAVLYCSIAVHCNPLAEHASQAAQPLPSQTVSQAPQPISPDKRPEVKTEAPSPSTSRGRSEMAAKIKLEPLSQGAASQSQRATARQGQKRRRADQEEDPKHNLKRRPDTEKMVALETLSVPRQVKSKVKEEPVTPGKTDVSRARQPLVMEGTETVPESLPHFGRKGVKSGMGATSREQNVNSESKPAKSHGKESEKTQETSGRLSRKRDRSPVNEVTDRVTRSRSRSLSPNPTPTPNPSLSPSPSPSPPPKHRRRLHKSEALDAPSAAPSKETSAVSKSGNDTKTKESPVKKAGTFGTRVKNNTSGLDDDLVGDRKPVALSDDDGDLFSTVPRRRRNKDKPVSQTQGGTQAQTQNPIGGTTNPVPRDQNSRSGASVKDEDPVEVAERTVIPASDEEKGADVGPPSPLSDAEKSPRPSSSPLNFLSRRGSKREAGDFVKASDNKLDETLPSRLLQLRDTSLLARQPGQVRSKPKSIGDSCMWKGRKVKNFKKFRKVLSDAGGLPSIIGGTDLVAHDADDKKGGELFKDYLEAESQKTERDKQSTDILDFGHIKKRRY